MRLNFWNSPEMCDSLKRRNINIDVSELDKLSKRYILLKDQKNQIEVSRVKVSEKISKIDDKSNPEFISLNNRAKILRNDAKSLKTVIQELETKLSSLILKLPNTIHNKTQNKELEYFVSPIKSKDSKSHLEIGKSLKILEYNSPTSYFLKNDAALFELLIIDHFLKNLTLFTPISNPDFCRQVIKEIIEDDVWSLGKYGEDDYLYLHGGASYIPYLSYFYKTVVKNDVLPLRFVTQGKSYTNQVDDDLYSPSQCSAIQIFTATSIDSVEKEFHSTVDTVIDIYKTLDLPFRVVYCPASSLKLSESLRADFEVLSPYHKKFKNAGNISMYGDFYSKRTNAFYVKDNVNYFSHIISGSVVKVQPILASYLEVHGHCEPPNVIKTNSFL